jgi:hypothetical protein
VESQNTGSVTSDYLFEVAHFISVMKEDRALDVYGMQQDLRRLFEVIERLMVIAEEHPGTSKIDI